MTVATPAPPVNRPAEQAKTALSKTKVKSLAELITDSVGELGKALPTHMSAERLARIARTAINMTPRLSLCEPRSIIAAIFQCASVGLEPVAGQAWLIPYSIKGRLMAQFQIGAYGWVDLFYRHHHAVSLHVETIYAEEEKRGLFTYDLGQNSLSHRRLPFGEDPGPVIGYWAAARLINHGFAFKVMSRLEVLDIAQRFSKCYDEQKKRFIPGSPWAEHFDAMGHKTLLKRLIKPLPKSIEIQRALQMDETVKTRLAVDMIDVPAENTIEVAQEESASTDTKAEEMTA